ncbi:TlpA family protein disulfide reductase [Tenacibaculum sp. MEBiC06402]|uniref:TlpA family protein disulfide reductase n=1 Tax=unclassified Tenacibaculum TaxID=2635139 RepID=UPI003B9C3CB9
MNRIIKYLVPLLSIFIISCNDVKKENFTYVGGKIINPKSDFITLHDHFEEIIDTVKLNSDNTFTGSFKDIKSGLYLFKHGTEFQYIFLEPQDSLLIRLNTWDFDESLVFSGSNAEKNNALIENFLINEKQVKDFYKFYKLPHLDFLKTVDSLKSMKDSYLNNFKSDYPEATEDYLDILKVALYFPLYTKLETYVINNRLKESPEDLNEANFISHRENIDINSDSLMFFSPYRKYVYNNIYYDVYAKNIKDDSDEFTISVLETVNTKIGSQELKNRLLKETIIRHFYTKTSCSLNKKAYSAFATFSSNDADKKEIASLLSDVKRIPKNKLLPNFKLYSPQGSIESIKDIIRGNSTVIYFRNKDYSSDNWVSSRMNYLIKNHPDVQFLVINMNDDKNEYIKDLNIKHQFYLHKESDAHSFLTSKYPRMVLVNNKGKVVNGFCALSSKKIEKQITELY